MCDKIKDVCKRFGLPADFSTGEDKRIGTYYNTMDSFSPQQDIFYQYSTLKIVYDARQQRILAIAVEYTYQEDIREEELRDLAKEVHFKPYRDIVKPFVTESDGVTYSLEITHTNHGGKACYTISQR